MTERKQIGEWSESEFTTGEWQNGGLFLRVEGDELVLCDSHGSYNVYTRLPLAVIDAARRTPISADDFDRLVERDREAEERGIVHTKTTGPTVALRPPLDIVNLTSYELDITATGFVDADGGSVPTRFEIRAAKP